MKWNRQALKRVLRKFRGKKIAVIGDVGVDRYTVGLVERISPEAPVPILLVQEQTLKLGLSANVADNVQALGGVPLLSGVVGADLGADELKRLLRAQGISSTGLVTQKGRATVLKERIVSERQQLLRVDYESQEPIGSETETRLITRLKSVIRGSKAVILEDYAKGMLTERVVETVFTEAHARGCLVLVDPNHKSCPELYRGADVLTPNLKEAEGLTGIEIRSEKSLREAGNCLLELTGGQFVVITRGKEGMSVFESGVKNVRTVPTFAREVYDVSGAGDTVVSVLALALCAGGSIEEAVVLGNIAAGIEVGKRGTATVSQDEILNFIKYL